MAAACCCQHLVSLYYDPKVQSVAPAPYSLAQLSEYISYARANFNPVISDDAFTELVTVSGLHPAALD